MPAGVRNDGRRPSRGPSEVGPLGFASVSDWPLPKCRETARVSSLSCRRCTVPPGQRDPIRDQSFMTELLKQFYSKPRLIPGVQTINRFEPLYKQYLKQSVRELTHDEPLRDPQPEIETRYEYLKQHKAEGRPLGKTDRKQLNRYKKIEHDVMSGPIVPYKAPRAKNIHKKKGKGTRRQAASEPPRTFPSIGSSISQGGMSTSSTASFSAPVAVTKINRSGTPKIRYRPNGDCRIAHREFIYDLPGSVAFACTTFNINPGLPVFCPWLSKIATSFESYIVHKFQVRFETESPTSTAGTVVIAIDYDASDAAPTTKAQALAYRGTVRSAPWAASCHTSLLEDLRKRSSYFVRGGSLATGKDVVLYDIGNLYLITQGMAGTSTVGEIWIDYDIEFRTPQSFSAGGGNAVWSLYTLTNNTTFALTNGNLPATFVFTPGAGASTLFTFVQPWQGILSVDLTGAGFVFAGVNFTGTGVVSAYGNTGAAQTGATGFAVINAVPGSTVNVAYANGGAAGAFYFTQGLGAFS